MIRVAVLFTNYGPYHLAWAEALSKVRDIEVDFIEFAPKQRLHPWRTLRENLDLPITTLVDTPLEQTPLKKLIRELYKNLEARSPQALVIPGYREPFMRAAARWARKHGAASILMFASTELDHQRVWWKEQVKCQLVRRYYDAGFVNGQASRQYLSKLGMSQSRIWEPSAVVDNRYFDESSRNILLRADEYRKDARLPERYFLYVGRFYPEKNLVRLLRAYRRYHDLDPGGWKLVMVGDGPQRDELHETARELDLDDIVWSGYKQIEKLPTYYALSSCLVLPSLSEPWGLVVNEAMACGLPVLVSSRCGSAADLVREDVNGYTFDPLSVDELASRMQAVAQLEEPERQAMVEASRRLISGRTPEVRATNLADCIRRTVGRVQRDGNCPEFRNDE